MSELLEPAGIEIGFTSGFSARKTFEEATKAGELLVPSKASKNNESPIWDGFKKLFF